MIYFNDDKTVRDFLYFLINWPKKYIILTLNKKIKFTKNVTKVKIIKHYNFINIMDFY